MRSRYECQSVRNLDRLSASNFDPSVRRLDFRQTPDKKRGGDRAEGIDPRPFYGLEYLLLRSHWEDGLEADEEEDAGAPDDRIHVANFTDLHR